MAEFLIIDAGNTLTKWATARPRGKIQVRGDMSTGAISPASLHNLAAEFPSQRVILACVVPKLIPHFQRAFGRRLHNLTGQTPGLTVTRDYPKPSELGADRIAAALAAQADGVWPVIIVSCGTATAVTVLNAKGHLSGGAIAPGLQTQLAALTAATAQLPPTTLTPPKRLPANSTREAIRAGVFLSFQGGVREMVERLGRAVSKHADPRLLLTGGDVKHVRKMFGRRAELRPLLVFEGLRIMGARLFFTSAS